MSRIYFLRSYKALAFGAVLSALFLSIPIKGSCANTATETPYGFIENKGQITDQQEKPNPRVKYLLNSPGLNIQLKGNSFSYDTYVLTRKVKQGLIEQVPGMPDIEEYELTWHFHRIDIEFIGAAASPELIAEGAGRDYLNYYTTGTTQDGATGVRHFNKITYKNLYPGIDLEFEAWKDANTPVKYNFIVHAGADASQIKWRYKGSNGVEMQNGTLSINTANGYLNEDIPLAYEKESGRIMEVSYKKSAEGVFSFSLPPATSYKTLIIDPVPDVLWSTYFGDSGDELGLGVTTDDIGNLYVTGSTTSSSKIATSGANQTTYGGSSGYGSGGDVFIMKLTAARTRLWSSYYGGSGNEWSGSIKIDKKGNIYVGGATTSSSGMATSGAFQTSLSNTYYDAFLARFDASGKRIWGTYYGGTGNDLTYYNSLVIDKTGENIFMSGTTNSGSSQMSSSGAHQTTYGGGPYDAYIIRFDSSGTRKWSTYHGGSGDEYGFGLGIDDSANVYLTGYTTSTSGIATTGAYQTSHGGDKDALVVKFDSSGTKKWGTYFGGSKFEHTAGAITVDIYGNIFLSGYTESTSGVATSGAYQTSHGGGTYDAYLAKFNASGTSLLWATYFGGSGDDYGYGRIVTNKEGAVFLTGYTTSTSYIATTNAFQTSFGGGTHDAFVLKMDASGTLKWATYYGGNGQEVGYGLVLDKSNNVLITGRTGSSSGIPTKGGFQTSSGGGTYDAYIAVLQDRIGYNNAAVSYLVTPNAFCPGKRDINVLIKNAGLNKITSLKINWSLDGTTQTAINYTGTLDSVDCSTCKTADTVLLGSYTFGSTSSLDLKAWTSDPNGVQDTVNADDTLTVTLTPTVSNPSPGKQTLWVKSTPFSGLYKAGTAKEPDGACLGDTISFEIAPPAGMTNADYGTTWVITDFSFKTANGYSSANATKTYPSSSGNGKFTFYPKTTDADSLYRLNITIQDPSGGCDSSFFRYIQAYPKPSAAFSTTQTSYCLGTQVQFTNTGTLSPTTKYKWYFGDGITSADTNSKHTYSFAGTYTISLVAYNDGCSDSIAKSITIEAPATGAGLKEGSPFNGYFFNGTSNDPDLSCVRDTLTYEIVPPPSFKNADYGTTWEVISHSIKSTGGTSTSNYTFNAPSSSNAGSIVFKPTFAEADLTFIISTTFRALNSTCKDTIVNRYVSVSTSPTADFNINGQCVGKPTYFTDASTVAPGLVVRKYEFGVNNAFATTANPNYTYPSAGEYEVTLTVTGKGGCSDVIKKKINIYNDPTADFDVPAIVCAGNAATFINKANGNGTNVVRYKWTFTEGAATDTSEQGNAAYTFKTTGTHSTKLQVWTDGGCSASVSKTITVVDAPTANFPDPKGCLNQDITFTNNSSGATSYEWRFSDNQTYYTKEVTRKFEFPSTYEVTMVAISASGCRDSMTKTMNFYPQPTMDFSWSGGCADQVVHFIDATTVANGGSIIEWNWTIDGTVKKSGNKMSYTFTAGIHEVKLKVKTSSGCTDSFTKNITIEPKPVANVTIPSNACVDEAVNFQNSSTGTGNTYLWTFGDGGSSTDAQPSHIYKNKGTYPVKMILTSSKGCKDSVTKTLTVGSGPSVPFDWCADGRKVHFYLTDKTYSTYEWEFGDALGGTATGTDPVYTYLSANGEYEVTVTVTDAVGCEGKYTATVGIGFLDNSTVKTCTNSIEEITSKKLNLNIYPNPFSHKTLIEYELLKSQQVRVSVWDATGKEVAVLSNGMEAAGMQQVSLDANEHKLQPGLYMIRIETAGTVAASQVLKLE